MQDILVSIVIVNFNYAGFLATAIDSALAQTYPVHEVIVVDDCSTDDSVAVIRSYADRVRPVLRKRNGGMSAAVNSGYALTSGAIVMIVDADDFLYPDAVATVVDAWQDGVVVGCFDG